MMIASAETGNCCDQ